MPVKITDVFITPELSTQSVNWLLANVGDKIQIQINFTVETSVVSSTDNPIIMNAVDGFPPIAGSEWCFDAAARFTDFRVGDTVYISEYNPILAKGTFTIVEKLDDTTIRISGSTGYGINGVGVRILMSVSTPITAARYKWNFIENAEATTFQSKIDGSEQILFATTISGSVLTPVGMVFAGNESYQIGDADIRGAGIDTGVTSGIYRTNFIIFHRTFLTPYILSAQWDDLLNLIAPIYFNNGNSLKAILDLEAMYDYNDPNRIQTVELTEVLGNTGWFNENFNTGITNYLVSSVVYKRPTTAVIPAIELVTTETTVEITITNTVDSPFSNTNTKFALNFSRVPDNEADYQLNGQTIIENFFFDRALQTVGVAAVNGENFGTDQQVLKDITATFISSSSIKIICKIAMDSNVVDTIDLTDSKQYMLWVAVQDHTLATDVADKVALLADAQEFFEDTTSDNMLVLSNTFLKHPFTDVDTEAVAGLSMFPNDEVVGYTRFYIDRAVEPSATISLKSADIKLVAFNSTTLEEFTLENFKIDLASLPIINSYQFINFSLDRQFHVPAGEIRKTIKIKRRADLDTATEFYYDIIYPYIHRWEYWLALSGVDGDFFDTAEPNNGFNHFWHRYRTIGDWGIAFKATIKATRAGDLNTYSLRTFLGSNDYDSNPDWLPATIKTYEHSTNTLLTSGGTNYILGYTPTRVEAEFTKVSSPPVLSQLRMVIWIEAYESGGIDGSRRISSVYAYDSDTWFASTDDSKKIIISVLGSVAKGVCLIDENLIPLTTQQYKITARIYELGAAAIDNKLFQDADNMIFQDADNFLFQDQ